VTVAAHFLLSMALIVLSAALVSELSDPVTWSTPPRSEVHLLTWALDAVLAVVLVLGTVVTGSGPHSGDADAPTRFGFDPRAASWLHADAVLVFCGILAALILVLRLTGAPERALRRAWWLVGATVAQGLIGYVQYAAGLPEVLVALHMLGASLLTAAATFLTLAMRPRT
jgi:cytochrome c oxidase assembly protein subunit 15